MPRTALTRAAVPGAQQQACERCGSHAEAQGSGNVQHRQDPQAAGQCNGQSTSSGAAECAVVMYSRGHNNVPPIKGTAYRFSR